MHFWNSEDSIFAIKINNIGCISTSKALETLPKIFEKSKEKRSPGRREKWRKKA
jgi:hypothetical protein